VRTSTIVMIAFAVVFGLLAVFVAQSWLNRQAEIRLKHMEAAQKSVPGRTVVVASAPLRFGMPLAPQSLREVSWPQEAIPAGTFPLHPAAHRGRQAHRAGRDRGE
jgi:pilus assembly protein CpaB